MENPQQPDGNEPWQASMTPSDGLLRRLVTNYWHVGIILVVLALWGRAAWLRSQEAADNRAAQLGEPLEAAKAFAAKGDFDSAMVHANRLIDISPNNAAARLVRGGIYHELKNYEAALADFAEAVRIGHPNPRVIADTFANGALVRFDQGNFEKAIEDATHAIELVPDVKWYYETRRDSYREMSRSLYKRYDQTSDQDASAKALYYARLMEADTIKIGELLVKEGQSSEK